VLARIYSELQYDPSLLKGLIQHFITSYPSIQLYP